MAKPEMFLRKRSTGAIYSYNEYALKDQPLAFDVVTEEEAFPERFAPKSARGRKSAVALTTEEKDIPTPPEVVGNQDVNEEASKGL